MLKMLSMNWTGRGSSAGNWRFASLVATGRVSHILLNSYIVLTIATILNTCKLLLGEFPPEFYSAILL